MKIHPQGHFQKRKIPYGPIWAIGQMRKCLIRPLRASYGSEGPYKAVKGVVRSLRALWQFLVCFQVRGAPGEGQGDPGARRGPEDPGNVVKPIGNLWKTSVKAI